MPFAAAVIGWTIGFLIGLVWVIGVPIAFLAIREVFHVVKILILFPWAYWRRTRYRKLFVWPDGLGDR